MSKRSDGIAIMIANSNLPMSAVVPLIAEKFDEPIGNARGFYKWAVKNNKAPGVIEETAREPKIKAEGSAPKVKKVKEAVAVPAAPKEDPEKLKKIREANLAKMKEVAAKRKPSGAVPEKDSFAAPKSISKKQLASVI